MTDADVRHRLIERRAQLVAETRRIEADLATPLDDDFAEQAVDREDDEALDAIERAALDQIAAIDAALARLEAGSYGLCVGCGAPIAPRRLEVMPEAAECIGCASQ